MKIASGHFVLVLLLCSVPFLSSCHRAEPQATKRYPFTGRIVSIDRGAQSANVDGDLVQGFMEPMLMTYKIKPASVLAQLSPGDRISAEVVVVERDPRDDNAESDYWLENVKVTAHRSQAPAAGPKAFHIPAPGEEVPDFRFTNQDGDHIALDQFHHAAADRRAVLMSLPQNLQRAGAQFRATGTI